MKPLKMIFAVEVLDGDDDKPEETIGSEIEEMINENQPSNNTLLTVRKVYLIHPDDDFDHRISAGQLST